MTEIRAPKRCGLFHPGHEAHFVQCFQAIKDETNLSSLGELIEARTDGTTAIKVDGQELYLWNHEPERIAEAIAISGNIIEFQPRWGLLWIPSTAGRYAFCVAPSPDDHVQCPAQFKAGSPRQKLGTYGRFIVFANDPWNNPN